MVENILIPLSGFVLPPDFPWRIGFVALVNEQLRRLRASGQFLPPRFFGYYIQEDKLVSVAGSWTIVCDVSHFDLSRLKRFEKFTEGKYSISCGDKMDPDFIFIHDRGFNACWLWSFTEGRNFVEAYEPTLGNSNDGQTSNLLEP